MLAEATQEDLEDALEECGVKKGHRRALCNAVAELRQRAE